VPELPTRRRILRKFRIDEISSVTNPAQEGARAVIMKSAELAPNLPGAADDPVLPPVEATPAENAAAVRHNVRARDLREREAAAREDTLPRTLADVDRLLEDKAREQRRDDETLEQAFARLANRRETSDSDFPRLLRLRDRIEREGPLPLSEA